MRAERGGATMTRPFRTHPVAAFFLLAWGLSWLVMVPLARHGVIAALPGWLQYLSAWGRLLAAVSSTVVIALGLAAVFRLGGDAAGTARRPQISNTSRRTT